MLAELLLELAHSGVELGRFGRSSCLLALQALHAVFRRAPLARRVPIHGRGRRLADVAAQGPRCDEAGVAARRRRYCHPLARARASAAVSLEGAKAEASRDGHVGRDCQRVVAQLLAEVARSRRLRRSLRGAIEFARAAG